MANKKVREQEIQSANKKKYSMAKKTLKIWPLITTAILVVTALTTFVPFIEIYNNPAAPGAFDPTSNGGKPFIEIGASGWQCIIIALKNDYTSAQSRLSAFYYWVTSQGGQPYVTMLAVSSFAALAALVVSLALQIAMFFTKAHGLSAVAAVFDIIMAAAFILAFASALMCSGEMLEGYCNNNPACSVRSFAIFPALLAAAAAVLDFIHLTKHNAVEKLAEN